MLKADAFFSKLKVAQTTVGEIAFLREGNGMAGLQGDSNPGEGCGTAELQGEAGHGQRLQGVAHRYRNTCQST